MKFGKTLICLLFCFSSLLSTSCSTKEQTKYYIPETKNKYEIVNFNKFNNDFKANKKFDYDYFVAVIKAEKPVEVLFGFSTKKEYFVGKINKDFSPSKNDWFEDFSTMYSINHLEGFNYIRNILCSCYNFDEECTYYSNPNSFVNNNDVKVVFDDSFLISTIFCSKDDNKFTIEFKYFNEEDLPTTGKIDRDTYHEVAYVRSNNSYKNYNNMYAEIDGKDILLGLNIGVLDNIMINEPVYGDAKVGIFYDIKRLNYEVDKLNSYVFVKTNTMVLSGKIDEHSLGYFESSVGGSCAIMDSLLISNIVSGENTKTCKFEYSLNPLTVNVSSGKYKYKATFNDEGLITSSNKYTSFYRGWYLVTYKYY